MRRAIRLPPACSSVAADFGLVLLASTVDSLAVFIGAALLAGIS